MAGIRVKSLDQDALEHPEWFEELTFPDLPRAMPDIQRRIALGCEHILIEVVEDKATLPARVSRRPVLG